MHQINSMDFARLSAIKQFSDLEYQICMLFMTTLKLDHRMASIVFHRITNTRSRYAIIADALNISDELQFPNHWKKIEKWLSPCDQLRNQIIHWEEGSSQVIYQISQNQYDSQEIVHLQNPAKRGQSSAFENSINEEYIWNARDKMRVMTHIVNRFWLTMKEREKWLWMNIFENKNTCDNPIQYLEILNSKGVTCGLPPYRRDVP